MSGVLVRHLYLPNLLHAWLVENYDRLPYVQSTISAFDTSFWAASFEEFCLFFSQSAMSSTFNDSERNF